MKIGDTVTKEEFIKFAPLGMELTIKSTNAILKYSLKHVEILTSGRQITGYIYCRESHVALMDGAWECFYDCPQQLTISKLPILKLLKRKSLCTQS